MLLFALKGQGQSAWHGGIQAHYGFLIAHRPSMVHLVENHVKSIETYIERSLSSKPWHMRYNSPVHGLSINIGNLANPKMIGMGFGLIHYVKFKLAGNDNFSLGLRLGTGVGYLTKTFDRTTNNKNNAIGSHFNGLMSTQLEFTRVWERFQLGAGLSLLHYSNGAMTMPNLGLNMPSAFLSLNYRIKEPGAAIVLHNSEYYGNQPRWTFSTLFSGGIRELGQPLGPKYTCFTLETFASRILNSKTNALFGIDVFNNGSLSKAWQTAMEEDLNRWKFTQLGLMAGIELGMDELKISLQQGFYVISKYKGDGNYYQRLALRYFFKNNMIAQFALKTHFAKADYFELGLGYRFAKSKTIYGGSNGFK